MEGLRRDKPLLLHILLSRAYLYNVPLAQAHPRGEIEMVGWRACRSYGVAL